MVEGQPVYSVRGTVDGGIRPDDLVDQLIEVLRSLLVRPSVLERAGDHITEGSLDLLGVLDQQLLYVISSEDDAQQLLFELDAASGVPLGVGALLCLLGFTGSLGQLLLPLLKLCYAGSFRLVGLRQGTGQLCSLGPSKVASPDLLGQLTVQPNLLLDTKAGVSGRTTSGRTGDGRR